MNIKLNNNDMQTNATNLQALAEEMNLPERGVAMAIDNKMVPRTEWATTTLTEGISVIMIKAACGG